MVSSDEVDRASLLKARRLRHAATDAEKRLWRRLRKFEIEGSHFRRQVPIGPYVADFACMAARLLIEVDGWRHGNQESRLRDEARTRWLEKQGFRVIRVWNNEIDKNIEGVMEKIYAEIYGSLSAEPVALRHLRHKRARTAPPRRALRAGPPPAGEGN
ncbi:MAG TPA: endonuclease domain-containing protein [Xanthobacteraceae bacterium]|jgi:very-short-patch-repair endonuclease|nr:endonuclease domain-containing protein [Xanthobacteraceae bacterium]